MSIRPLNPERNKWQIDVYPRGQKGSRARLQFSGNEAEARDYEMQLRQGVEPSAEKDCKLADVYTDWMDEYENNVSPNTLRDATNCFKHLTPFFSLKRFSYLKPKLIEQYKALRLSEGVSKRTINKELTYLSSFCKWALEEGYAPSDVKIKKFPKVTSPIPVIPSPEDISNIYEAIEPEYKLLFLLYYDAGLRRDEGRMLRAKDVHLGQGLIIIKRKGGREKIIPITTERLFLRLQESMTDKLPGDYLSVNPKTGKPWYSIRKALIRAAKTAGVTGRVYHHLLRHSFGTHALDAGIDMRAIQGILGHSKITTTEIYAQIRGSYLKKEGKKFDDFISKNNQSSTSHRDK